jgi:hypothetical protein
LPLAAEATQTVLDPGETVTEQPPEQRTGHPAVDAALDSLAGLDGAPVDEHVAVFEAAHDALRGALADAANSRPSA